MEPSDMYEAREQREVCERLVPALTHRRAHTRTLSIAEHTKTRRAQRRQDMHGYHAGT